MKFSTNEDIEVPIEYAFAAMSNFEYFETVALRNGAEVARTDVLSEPGPGMHWAAAANVRGRRRKIDVELTGFDRPNAMSFEGVLDGINTFMEVSFLDLSARRTRVGVSVDLKPQSISARLLVQSARLAKNSLNTRFKTRINGFIQEIETRYRKSHTA